MNAELKDAFTRIKPICDVIMVCPTIENVDAFITRVSELKKEVVQELQQYLLFPLITHISSEELMEKYILLEKMSDVMGMILEKVVFVNSYEMCLKIETALLSLVFDKAKPGMIADVSEKLKLSVMTTLTQLMLKIDSKYRVKLLKTQVPLIAQAVFVSVHIAKLEKFRALRLQAIKCVTAHTAVHPYLKESGQLSDVEVEAQIVDMLSSILPGVLAALQDVATCANYPGHGVVCEAIYAIHKMLCLTMNDKYLNIKVDVTAADFAKMIIEKANRGKDDTDVNSKKAKDLPKRSPEWFVMAGDKLTLVTESLVALRTHEHYKVRRELAVFCHGILTQCNLTMQQSVPLALDVLISLAEDEYPEVSRYCEKAVSSYLKNASEEARDKTMDSLCDNFFSTLTTLPGVLNNIDSSRKLSSLNLLHGYVQVLCDEGRPQRLTVALSVHARMRTLCNTLTEAASVHNDLALLTRTAYKDVTTTPPTASPWCKLRHLDTIKCEKRLQDICKLLGGAECSELILDSLMEVFLQQCESEVAYLINWMGCAPKSSTNLAKRILNTYLEENIWYQPLEVGSSEPPITKEETLDTAIYNPRAWTKESVPDLYEGATETRYTDISYQTPRSTPHRDPNLCATLAEAQRNMVLLCLITEGVGMMAKRLMDDYQPYLLKSLCQILERVGSRYEMLHLAGLKAINDVASACGHDSPSDLIKHNADYFTNQITVRLKKAWNCQSALQILSVVMEYSDSSILDYLYGITQDVLVQSCDRYYEKDLNAYLQVFLTFVDCIRKWYPIEKESPQIIKQEKIDLLQDLRKHIENEEDAARLLSKDEFEKESGKSVEEMFKEDQKSKEDDVLDYEDTVTQEKQPLPQHMTVTITIIKRCLHFVTTKQRDNSILALQVLDRGLPLLGEFEDELLPLVHQSWAPLVVKLRCGEPPVMRRAFDLFVTMAGLARDFIRSRAVKEVLPDIYKYLQKSAKDSYLKDAGSAYRNSQAFMLQVTALDALPHLAIDLMLEDEGLEEAMKCVDPYLSNKQPKPLQTSAVEFFKKTLDYDYGAAWHHLRVLGNNDEVLVPPDMEYVKLEKIVGTPFQSRNKDYESNFKLIFEHMILEVLPDIYKYLQKSAKDSYLKDAGSAYRNSQAFMLQVTALDALPHLAIDLMLEDEGLEEAMKCVDPYLSNKQPKPLQTSAVEFFKKTLDYDYGAAWHHLRVLGNNDEVLVPPDMEYVKLEKIVGTPFQSRNKDYESNFKLIFEHMIL